MKSSLFILLVLALSTSAYAQQTTTTSTTTETNTTSAKVSDVQKPDEQIKEDSEQQITNARMRAEAGSKSKYSIKTQLNYYGGSLERPLAERRPDYASGNVTSTEPDSYLSGTFAIAYRLSQTDAVRFGTGLAMIRPFHANSSQIGNNVREENGQSSRIMNVSTPYLEFSRSFRGAGLQQALSFSYNHATKQRDVETVKQTGYLYANHTLLGELFGFQPGLVTSVAYWFYKDDAQAFDSRTDGRGRPDYEFAITPFIEYAFNDTFSFRTVSRFWIYDHFRSDEGSTFLRAVSTQSAGLSIAIGKTTWLYPNVQWVPEDTRAERTNVGLSSTFSVF